MEHPYLFLVDPFKSLGLESVYNFAHHYPQVIYSWFVMALLIALGLLGTKAIAMVPTKAQNVFEMIVSGIEEFMIGVTGEEGRWLFPVAATIFLYIFASNTTLSCAIVVFVITHYIGIKYHGAKYYKHFIGPVWWMSPLIGAIEIIGHLARILSLTFRLFGNMAGHELVLAILFMLAGIFFAPLPIMALGIFVAFVQAFVFFLLSIIYFTGSIEHAH